MARKIFYYVAVSADGFIARLDGAVEWLDRPQPKGGYGMAAFYKSVGACILGRKTFDFAAAHGMKDGYVGKKNYVFSRTISPRADSSVQTVAGDVKAFARRLRAQKGKNIWLVGGGEIAAAFLDAGEVDEIFLHVIPVLIGEGIPLFGAQHRHLELKLLRSKTFPDGVVLLHYAVRR
jgi:dihydrofolate reductase